MTIEEKFHNCDDLVELFNSQFLVSYRTELVKGGHEPIYLPGNSQGENHRVIFTKDYFASALHEIVHWCIAGEARRTQIDFGYWYIADGRTAQQQRDFEEVEFEPQAMEWIFSVAARYPFRVSTDNLLGEITESDTFKDRVFEQVLSYCKLGFPSRAELFRQALASFYGGSKKLQALEFQRAAL